MGRVVDVAGTFGSDRPGTFFGLRTAHSRSDLPWTFERIQGAAARIERGWNIYREGDSENYVYKVLAGAACTYKILVDGRRQTERSSVTVLA